MTASDNATARRRVTGRHARIGALVPLTPPGWAAAGRHLLAGLELGARDAGGLELLVRDTAADPDRAAAAADELAGLGVDALAGEFHSVVARAVARRADALGLPFLCSSAVLDALTDAPTDHVARLAPPQSRGWRVYADFLLAAGHRRIAVATQPSAYWEAGTGILRERLAAVTVLDAAALAPAALSDALAADGATALLLLVGHPQPAVSIVRALRADPRHAGVLIGAPAGQPELPDWAAALGAHGAGIPFLRYLPARLGPLGERVRAALRDALGEPPSFVALEGYDTLLALAARLPTGSTWGEVAVMGTRGPISFSRERVWQWPAAPIQVADRDPADPQRFRVLR